LVAWALVAELAGGIVSIGADIVFDYVLVIDARDKENGLTRQETEWIEVISIRDVTYSFGLVSSVITILQRLYLSRSC